MYTLIPCPYCNSNNVQLISGQFKYGHCNECGADGPTDLGESGAVEKWNARPREEQARERDQYRRAVTLCNPWERLEDGKWRCVLCNQIDSDGEEERHKEGYLHIRAMVDDARAEEEKGGE